jgi:hypothetical protein
MDLSIEQAIRAMQVCLVQAQPKTRFPPTSRPTQGSVPFPGWNIGMGNVQVTGNWMIPRPLKTGANNIINDRFSATASGKMEEEGLLFSSHILYTYQ